ncbi:hypothetical protein NC653_004084 [Populus alba x Populus x berolinensis]|uniref:Uncharacterized protein n=1 Tax=Populus alba x Populus x berolinensis TaxID=444605 RepID=A0AAD6WJI7_9ROSI|nr:hypothetical protein NC653_004084 [Populus alba x Populus x berolinensis]
MVVESYISSIINVATPIVPMLNSTENLQPIDNDMDTAAATGGDDFHREILRLLDLSGGYDEADVVPATHAVEASSYWLQATPTLDEPFTPDGVDRTWSLRFQPYQLISFIFTNAARSKSYITCKWSVIASSFSSKGELADDIQGSRTWRFL